MVMATPALRCLREGYPRAHIALVLRRYVRDIVAGAPWFDEVIEAERADETLGTLSCARLVQRIRAERFDLAVLLPNSFRSALVAALAGVRHRVGYVRDARGALLTHPVPRPSDKGRFRPTYMGDFYLGLCQRLGCQVDSRSPEVFTSPADDVAAREVLERRGAELRGPLVLLCPGASFGSSKHWPAARFARVADMLVARMGASIAITGGKSEAAMASEVRSAMQSSAVDITDIGKLSLLKSVVKRADLMVTVDSGSRHLAVALGKPVVVLMGPTHPGYTQTSVERGEVVRVDVSCGPCQRKRCNTDHRCMKLITPERVFEACIRAAGS